MRRVDSRRRVSHGDGRQVTSIVYAPEPAKPRQARKARALVLAHGAGADQEHTFMVDVAGRLARAGVRTITFNFPYMESGRRAPDPPAVLEASFRAVVADVRLTIPGGTPLFIGGKSLGGRMASHLAASGDPPVAGLVCLGYPLHPPGQPERLRTKHLGDIRVPVLIVQGTRDPFGGPHEIRAHTGVVKGKVTIVPVDQGDHSFKVPRRLATAESVMEAMIAAIVAWMDRVTPAR